MTCSQSCKYYLLYTQKTFTTSKHVHKIKGNSYLHLIHRLNFLHSLPNRKTGIVTSRSAVVRLTVCLTGESAVSTAFPFAGCSSSLRVPIFAWAGSEALPWLFIVSSQGPFIVSRAHLQAIGGGAEYIDKAVPGMKAHSLVLWNSLTSVEQNKKGSIL